MLASELIGQLTDIPDNKYKIGESGFENVPVELNYGLFALKYINHQKKVQLSQNKMKDVSDK